MFPTSTLAAGLFEHHDTTIPSSQTVEDVVVIGGNATVAGTVNNSVVVVNGDVHIRPSAHIKGVIVVIGGRLEQDEGADVANDAITISLDDATLNSLLIGAGLMVGIGAAKLAASLVMLILPVLIVAVGRQRTAAFVGRYRDAPRRKLFYTGFFSGLLLFAASVLLLLTLVGIPLILIIILLVVCALAIGLTIVGRILGEQIQGTKDRPEWMRTGVGAFILISAFNIPFFGPILFIAFLLFSLGVMTAWTVSLLSNRRKRRP